MESHHSFPSLTYSSDMPASLSVGHNSGSAWVSVSPWPLLFVRSLLPSLWFSPTIKYESALAKLKVLDISWSWLSASAVWLSSVAAHWCEDDQVDFCCPMRSRTHFWSFWFCRMAAVLCECACGPLSFLQDMERKFWRKKISNGFLKCFAFLPKADCNVFFFTVLNQ